MAPRQAEAVPGEGTDGPLKPRDLLPLPHAFYERGAVRLARDLVGRLLVRELDGQMLVGRIVEAEAYRRDDPASHSFRGPTARNRSMFGPPGQAYVYRSHGIHHCLNVVARAGGAVLLRALEPLEGLDGMSRRRGTDDPHLLCAGPGRLCLALGITLTDDAHDLTLGRGLWLTPGRRAPRPAPTPRVGITAAADRPWRFVDPGSPFLSRRVKRPG